MDVNAQGFTLVAREALRIHAAAGVNPYGFTPVAGVHSR